MPINKKKVQQFFNKNFQNPACINWMKTWKKQFANFIVLTTDTLPSHFLKAFRIYKQVALFDFLSWDLCWLPSDFQLYHSDYQLYSVDWQYLTAEPIIKDILHYIYIPHNINITIIKQSSIWWLFDLEIRIPSPSLAVTFSLVMCSVTESQPPTDLLDLSANGQVVQCCHHILSTGLEYCLV